MTWLVSGGAAGLIVVRLNGWFDGVLMFGAPDVYASQEALDNILSHLRPGARIVFFGPLAQ